MSAITLDTELLLTQSSQDADVVASAPADQRPGLFTRIMDALGRAYTIKMPDGEVVCIYPPF